MSDLFVAFKMANDTGHLAWENEAFLIDDISPSSLEINRSESCVVLFFNVKISID